MGQRPYWALAGARITGHHAGVSGQLIRTYGGNGKGCRRRWHGPVGRRLPRSAFSNMPLNSRQLTAMDVGMGGNYGQW